MIYRGEQEKEEKEERRETIRHEDEVLPLFLVEIFRSATFTFIRGALGN